MMQRRPSISEMSQPGALVPQQEPAYVAPFNPHGEGQQVAAEFGDDFDAHFPIVNADGNAIAVAANPDDAAIDIIHDEEFAAMLRMIDLQEQLTASIQRRKRQDEKAGLFTTSLAILLGTIALCYNTFFVSLANVDSDTFNYKDWGFIEFLALINAAILINLMIKSTNGITSAKGVLEEDIAALVELTDLPQNASINKAVKTLQRQFTTLSIEAHGRLETLYIDSIIEKLQRTLNPGTKTGPLAGLVMAAILFFGAININDRSGTSNAFWICVFGGTLLADVGALGFFLKHHEAKKVASYLSVAELALAEAITQDRDIEDKDTIEAMFEIKKAIAAPLSEATRRGITLFHTQQQNPPLLAAVEGGIELQLRRRIA
jgi:hypothetical protein